MIYILKTSSSLIIIKSLNDQNKKYICNLHVLSIIGANEREIEAKIKGNQLAYWKHEKRH